MAQLQVEAIRNGSVIDHIPAGQGINILKHFKMLDTTQTSNQITVGFNLPSRTMGAKDLIKISNLRLTREQINRLSMFAPDATVNIIEDYEVVGKLQPELPEKIENVYWCPNTNCISNCEPAVSTCFYLIKKASGLRLKCKYCEKAFEKAVVKHLKNG